MLVLFPDVKSLKNKVTSREVVIMLDLRKHYQETAPGTPLGKRASIGAS